MNIKPVADNVVIRGDKPEEVSKSGLILTPSKTKEAPERGIVLALGPQTKGCGFKVGDYVLFGKYDFDLFMQDGEELSIGKAERVFAVLSV